MLVVEVFRSADKTSGVQAADAIRTRIADDVPVKQLWVRPKQDLTNNLESSGFPVNEALNMNDAKQLAQLLRADVFIIGNVARDSAAGYRVDAQYVLTRDQNLIQPLGSFRVNKPDQAAGQISKEFQAAQKAFVAEKNCINNARQQKYDQAIAEARKGIAAYPNSTLNRICIANVWQDQKAPADSIIAITNEILKIDPRSKPALNLKYLALKSSNHANEATDVLLTLVGADPSNSRLLETVVNELAGNGQAGKAQPFVDQLVRDNPGDPNFLQLQMRVHLAAKDYKGGIAAGEELLKSDTASATSALFQRLAAAAATDSQPQKAAQLMAQAYAKFPNDAEVLGFYVDVLRAAGQNQQALDVIGRAIAANPKAPGLNLARAKLFIGMNQPDSAIAAAQAAVAAGDSASQVGPVLLAAGQNVLRAAQASKAIPDFQRAIQLFDQAHKMYANPDGSSAFLLGASSFTFGQTLLQQIQTLSKGSAADKKQACDYAKLAQDAFNTAQIQVPAGGKFQPQAAQAILTNLPGMTGYADQVIKALCK